MTWQFSLVILFLVRSMAQKIIISHTVPPVFRCSVNEVLGITAQQLLSYEYFGDNEYLRLQGEVPKRINNGPAYNLKHVRGAFKL